MPRVRLAAKRDADADAVALTASRCNRSRAPRRARPRYSNIGAEEIVRLSAAASIDFQCGRRVQEFTPAGAGQTLTAHVSPDPTMIMPAPAVLSRKLSGSARSLDDQELVSAWQLGSPQRLDFRCAGRRENLSAIYRRCFPKCRATAPRVARDVRQAA